MKTIDTKELSSVAGGVSKNDQLTSTLTSVQSSIKDLASQNNNNSGSNNLLLPMAMMMAFNRPQAPTVVAAGAAVAPASVGPVINISNRIGRRW